MKKVIRLRAWQKAALEQFKSSADPNFLAVATPGAGKTTFSLTAALEYLSGDPTLKLVIVVPTQHLKTQWSIAALDFDIHPEPEWSSNNQHFPSDMHGVVMTYQQVAANAALLANIAHNTFVILDEIHHAGDERSWGDGIRLAFSCAKRRLSVSGTPFRSDDHSIPFVKYDDDVAVPNFEYGYSQALKDRGVVRPVYFPRIDGQMEWTAPDGTYHSAGFSDALDNALASQRLRTALSIDGQWLPEVLTQAHRQLVEIRRTHTNAAGLVIASDQEHARNIGRTLEHKFGIRASIATSDDPMASARIAHFTKGTDPWIIAVRMVSEGVDIPRLRVGVFASNTTTDLFFRQAVGRLVRYVRGLGTNQPAYMFIPDDARLRIKAAEIAQHRRHSLRKPDNDQDQMFEAEETSQQPDEKPESLYKAISAVALGEPDTLDLSEHLTDFELDEYEEELTIELSPPPLLTDSPVLSKTTELRVTRAQQKTDLRSADAEAVRELVNLTGMSHKAINGELNRLAGIKRISEATFSQLESRKIHGERWISRLIRS